MSATLSKLRISWVGRALLAYAVSALALVVLGLAAPGSAVFFPLVSLWCNLALFGLVLVMLRLADVKFNLFHWAVIIGFWAAALLYFYWAETRRSFVYIWDYVNTSTSSTTPRPPFFRARRSASISFWTLWLRTIPTSTPCSSSSRSA